MRAASVPDPFRPAQRWALTADLNAHYAHDPRNTLEVPWPIAQSRHDLEAGWSVRNREDELGTLRWLLEDGHRGELARILSGLGTTEPAPDAPSKVRFVWAHREQLETNRIVAWDLCRLVNFARRCRRTGYIAEQEAWRWMFEASFLLRNRYTSWKRMSDDFALGLRYWSDTHSIDAYHARFVEFLELDPASPWSRVPFTIDPLELA